MTFSTEALVYLINEMKREDLNHVEQACIARSAFESGDLDCALNAIIDGVTHFDPRVQELAAKYYTERIGRVIKTSIDHKGYAILISNSNGGHSYTVGLAKNRAEIYIAGHDHEQAKVFIERVVATQDIQGYCVVDFEDGLSIVLISSVGLLDSGQMVHAKSWWADDLFPVQTLYILPDDKIRMCDDKIEVDNLRRIKVGD